ncbi:hypothetical protein [Sphingobium yanoikuyae]|uniref:hypothetical protein n=1 Tax=Sphingobium yanoikuyae TaxID=13690 RepID=UPI0022DD4A18|nr:hypothetical protein [Sphingobium yanoikuyae]WBQ16756.1 hypothetical protein PAE53_00725 [Sphingobium yanoikuyae]
MIIPIAGGAAVVLAAVALYLATPHQCWGELPFAAAAYGRSGAAMLVSGLLMLLSWAGPATALFIVATLLMTIWSVVPVVIAWWRNKRKGAA